jgi:hypothetical protein
MLRDRFASRGRGSRFVFVNDLVQAKRDTRRVRWGRRCKDSFEELSGHRCDPRLDHPSLHAEGAGYPDWRLQKVTGRLGRHGRRESDRMVFPCGRTKEVNPWNLCLTCRPQIPSEVTIVVREVGLEYDLHDIPWEVRVCIPLVWLSRHIDPCLVFPSSCLWLCH